MAVAPQRKRIRLGDLLVEQGLITEDQLKLALGEQRKLGMKLGRTLVEIGLTTENEILEALSNQLHIPLIDLRHFNFKAELVRLLPETMARRYRAIVLDKHGDEIQIGMADPTDLFAYDEIDRLLKGKLKLAVVREEDLLRAFDLVYRRTDEISNLAEELGQELSVGRAELNQVLQAEEVADTPVDKLLQSMFEDAVQIGASDIHIEPDETVLRIRERVDGVLHEQVMNEVSIGPAMVIKLKLMAGLNISEKRLPQDGRFHMKLKGREFDVRLSTMPVQFGESVVMRLLDQSSNILNLKELGMPASVQDKFQTVLRHPHGLVLVTGPTGSGKTTTLYAALNELNTAEKKIITAEDPVEYRLARISQVQVKPKIGLTFASVLRSALRQDPDIVLVGEMRDQETTEIALRAALTGHMVLSTLHTNDAVSSIDRLMDMGIQPYMIAASLRAVIAQRLVRRICESCAEPYQPDAQELAWLASVSEAPESLQLKKGRGCSHCNNTGYHGRIGVYEYMEMNRAMINALRAEDSIAFAETAKQNEAYQSLLDTSMTYARQGVTTLEEVIRVVGEVEEVESVIETESESESVHELVAE
jgi:MSHA biogenesis protein MshE